MTKEEKIILREIKFANWWYKDHKGLPTYADAIAWADEHPIQSEEEQVGMGGLGMKNKSEAYIQAKLRDHQEYLGCDEHRRKTLIMSDMYQLQDAYEDGYRQAVKDAIDILIDMSNDGVLIHIPHHEKFEKEIRKIMET